MYVDQDANIGNIGRFIQNSIVPELARATGVTRLPDYEVFVSRFRAAGRYRVVLFGIPILFMFAVLPLGALILPFLPGMHTLRASDPLGARGPRCRGCCLHLSSPGWGW